MTSNYKDSSHDIVTQHILYYYQLHYKCVTLNLLKPKVINFCHQYRTRPASQTPSSFHLDIPKIDNGQHQKCQMIQSFHLRNSARLGLKRERQ